MTKIKIKDFVEVEYTGKIKEDNTVFDTTDETVAKDNNIPNENMAYGPVVVCIGEKQLLEGLDRQLEGKETGKTYDIELKPEEAFGKKNAKLLKMIPSGKFRQQGVQPVPGLQINLDGMMGTIRTAAGGRIIVDFNHPLSGKEIIYNIKLNKIVTDSKEKVKEYVKLQLNQKEINVEITNDEAKITLKQELPKEIQEQFNKKIAELIPEIKKANFEVKKEEQKKEEQGKTPKKEESNEIKEAETVTSQEEQKNK